MAEERVRSQQVDTSTEPQPFGSAVQSRIDALQQRTGALGGSSQRRVAQSTAATTPTSGDDVLLGTPGDDVINALAGNDTVLALPGNDRVFGGPGNDDIIGGAGDDNLDGGIGSDLIFGDSDQNPDFSAVGNDTINGGDGNDTLFGGNGSDTINGGNGADNINGGFDNDFLQGGAGNDRFFAGEGDDRLFGEAGNDQLNGDAGNDTVDGGGGSDVVFGGQGDDSLAGDAGNDQVIGGGGNDNLSGGAGNDRLTGVDPFIPAFGFGRGERDNLTGGGGSDTFVLGTSTQVFYDNQGNNDFALINDFNLNSDAIELPANPLATANENGNAGQTLADAQVIPGGSARLSSINGTLSSNNDVDLYQINVTDGTSFSASTVGGTNLDTQLFLFDANGIGVLANDQASNSAQSTLSANSLNPGTYFLAISNYDNDPVSAGGLIFPTGFPSDNEVVGPTESGGGSPLSGFTGNGFGEGGDYTITLTGVSATPDTFSLGASPAGLPQGTAISFGNDLIGIVAGVSPSQLSLDSGNFVFV